VGENLFCVRNLKVLIVNTYHYLRGGDCTYAFSLAELLRSKGHEVFFFGMHHPQNFPCEQSEYFVDYIDFREMNRDKGVMNAVRVLSRSIYSTQAKAKLRQLVADLKPDIAHLQNIHAHLTPSVIFELKKLGIPVVWTLHDFKLICPNTHLLSHGQICESCKGGKFYQCTLKKCKKDSYAASLVATIEAVVHRQMHVTDNVDAFISPSAFLRNKFLEFGYKSENFYHISNFLQRDLLTGVKSIDGGYALYLGQLEQWKGIKTLIRAWSGMNGMILKIAGDGSLKKELEAEVANSGMKNIVFLGHLDKRSVQEVLAQASLVILPSEWYENYPYSVMEAMASGKPVIAANIGGLPEMVGDGETGLLFESGNSKDLKNKLEKLAGDSRLRLEMGKNAKKKADEEFSPELHYTKLVKIYNNVMSPSFA